MHKIRSSALALSGALSLVALTGCPNAGTQPPTDMMSVAPSAPASASATPSASESAPATEASVAPGASQSSSPLEPTTLRGKVYDQAGATVSSAKVRVRSLSAANPFDSTVDVASGSYVVNNVPAGVQLEVTAMRDGWTKRSRVETLLPISSSQANVVNFGGPINNTEDDQGAAYFISNYPEVSGAAATIGADQTLKYVITLSEPLSASDRRRFENGLSISTPDPNGGFITITKSSTFLGDRIQPTLSWDTTNTQLTFAFAAPLRASSDDKTTYSLRVSRLQGEDLIKDDEGNVLGYIAPAESSAYSEPFKLSSAIQPTTDAAQDRWAVTHTGSSTFDVAEDNTKPTLASVAGSAVTVSGVDKFRFSLTFSEPMRVYPDDSGFSSTATTLANYSFALSDKDDLSDVELNSNAPSTVTTPADATTAMNSHREFKFATGTVELSTTDPKVIYILVDRDLVPTDAKAFKIRVEDVTDPAGNVVSTGGKETSGNTADNIKGGTI